MAFECKPVFAEPADDWRRWFAWYPVRTLNAGWSWLRFVEWRPCIVNHYLDYVGGRVFLQYRR